ncbi:unnamed protein product [Larinioides sclopetarius]|uniref:Uncharacterized protein n=1 Tax=Larinioides sclopetarius TaxID=280406 RepID=A0AAV2BSX9_9ARAC
MTNVEIFGKNLFTILANKLIHEENSDSSEEKLDILDDIPDISKKNLGLTEKNLKYSHSNDDVSCSILMLSYVYRPIFTKRFFEVHSILMRAEKNPMIYVRCFAETSHKKYSPLKFLIVCSFISEIFVYLSKHLNSKKKHCYVQQTTEALNDVYQSIFEKDFPQNGWIDIQNEASKLAKGYQFLEPFMNSETSNIAASNVADAILTGNYKSEDDDQQTNVTTAETTSQEMVSVNTPSVPDSQVLMHIPVYEVPFLSPDGLSTNQTICLAPNLVYKPVSAVSFGTVEKIPYLVYLLHYSGDQTEAVTFENQPSGVEQNFQKVVEIAEPSNVESQAQETARSSVDEPVSSVWTPETSDIESQAQENSITRSSTDEPVSSSWTAELSNIESQAQENLPARSSVEEPVPSFRTLKLTESDERETCPAGSQDISDQELMHARNSFGKSCLQYPKMNRQQRKPRA